ncbi:hypothetical protein E2C01_027661 [Portunus trituberculatus]|uniref:Uncharacterized protein n=1 Tax=Portunus trituberculatus TaxID=210409 RepID=A0A5B7EM49_PORTR|nr:hypothetical protein [Portunus trituberculatus]
MRSLTCAPPPPAIQTLGVRGQGRLLGVKATWIPFIMFPTAIGKAQEVNKGENGSKGQQSVKKPGSEKRDYRKGKKLNKYTAEDKDKVLQLLEKGHRCRTTPEAMEHFLLQCPHFHSQHTALHSRFSALAIITLDVPTPPPGGLRWVVI